MKLHLVGGFLGSGKTTAIINATKYLLGKGERVGVVTNDQGKYLVDTAFFKLSEIPTVEVTGGCFCCNYDDLDHHLLALKEQVKPDVIFAESVGSCADIVATVIKPLIELQESSIKPNSFSVFTDSLLLYYWLKGEELPFSENVLYIFGKQIEEAGLLVINKMDLLPIDYYPEIETLARSRFPEKPIRFQNSLRTEDIAAWVELLQSGCCPVPIHSLDIDYTRYGDGEAQLAWLDEEVTIHLPDTCARDIVIKIIRSILSKLESQKAAIGHLKFLIQDKEMESKVCFTSSPSREWESQIPKINNHTIKMLINARIQTQASGLREIFRNSIMESLEGVGTFSESNVDFFHPQMPSPLHRM